MNIIYYIILIDTKITKIGLKILIERLKKYKPLKKINLEGNELNESSLKLMKENEEIFYRLDELTITLKDNIDKSELISFLYTFSSIKSIKIEGVKEMRVVKDMSILELIEDDLCCKTF